MLGHVRSYDVNSGQVRTGYVMLQEVCSG